MKIDFSCPVEILNIQIDSADNCNFQINNLAEQSIVSIELVLSSFAEDNELLYEQRERLRGFIATSREKLDMGFKIETVSGTAYTVLSVEKVWFDDAAIWRGGEVDEFDYNLDLLPQGKALNNLKGLVGHDAACYPSEQGEVWVCVCGRANYRDEVACVRCDRDKIKVFTDFNKETVESSIKAINEKTAITDKQTRIVAEQKKEHQSILEKRKNEKTKKIIFGLSISIAAVLVIIALMVFGLPAYNSNNADQLIKNGEFNKAIEILKALPRRFETENRLKMCDYGIAEQGLKSNDETTLQKAYETFISLNDYENSEQNAKQAKYQIGEIYLNNKDFDNAISIFNGISSYSNSRVKLSQANYGKALKLLENKEYTQALLIFEALGNYTDSEDKVMLCQYNLAEEALNSAEYLKAIELYEKCIDYSDSKDRIIETGYLYAALLFENKEFAKAGDFYLKAANSPNAQDKYSDAKTKANSCLYEAGKQAYFKNDYQNAAEYFKGIIDYVDSKTYYENALCAMAENLIDTTKAQEAIELLTELNDNKRATEIINRAKYSLANDNYEKGDFEKATRLFEEIINYSDSSRRLLQISYVLAEKEFESANYQKAAVLFDKLGDFSDSEIRKKQSIYNYAVSLMESKKYALASESFLSLGDFSDASDQSKKAVYDWAQMLENDGDLAKSIEKYEIVKGYSDSEDKLNSAIYKLAKAHQEKNEFDKAINLYSKILDFQDAELQYSTCKYKAAEDLYSKGNALKAAELFMQIGDWRDASSRAERCYDEFFETPAMLARKASEENNSQAAYDALEGVDFSIVPTKYEDLKAIYNSAAYNVANEAYSNKNIAISYGIYNSIKDFEDVSKIKLKYKSFRLMGQWETNDGEKANFYSDGSCEVLDEKYNNFYAEGYELYLGKNIDSLELKYGLSNLGNKSFALKDKQTQKLYKFIKISDDYQAPQDIVDSNADDATTQDPATTNGENIDANPQPSSTPTTPQDNIEPSSTPVPVIIG